jgi:hypothetical protein
MLQNFPHPPLSVARPSGRLESAFEAVLHAGLVSTPDQVRGLIGELDLVGLCYGIVCPAREPNEIAAPGLELEVVLAAGRLVKVPASMRDELTADLEAALAENVPMACMVHLVRVRLWRIDKTAWVEAISEILLRVEDDETCKMLTAVIAQHASGISESLEEAKTS